MFDAWPAVEVVEDIFRRLLGGDPVAQADLAAAVFEPLAAHLRRCHPRADEHACLTAAGDALLSLIRRPAVYDPARGTLLGFLRMAAEGDFRNELGKERRHHRGREYVDSVELADAVGNEGSVAADDLPSLDHPAIAHEIASLSPDESTVFDLMRQGVKATAAFATALGLSGPIDAQACEVKRVKDRVVKRLQRAVKTT